MFEGKTPFWTSSQESDAFVALVCRQLESAGYQVMRCFDLQNGTPSSKTRTDSLRRQVDDGDCRMVVVLAYGPSGPPVSLMFFGSPQKTLLYLAENAPGGKGNCQCDIIAQVLAKKLESDDEIQPKSSKQSSGAV